MKTMMMIAALLFATTLNMTAQTNENNLVYNTYVMDEHTTVTYTYGVEKDTLLLRLKNVHEYDGEGRIVKREVMSWNPWRQAWDHEKRWTYAYGDGRMTIELSKWNKRRHCYNPARSRQVYEFMKDDMFRVTSYVRNKKQDDLQLAGTVLLVSNEHDVLHTSSSPRGGNFMDNIRTD